MRKLDDSRVEGFVKKHIFLKRWVSIMLVVALLVTTGTMYALNKAASAVSEESSEYVGLVLNNEEEQESAENNTQTDAEKTNQTQEEVNNEGTNATNVSEDSTSSTEGSVESTEEATATESETAPEAQNTEASENEDNSNADVSDTESSATESTETEISDTDSSDKTGETEEASTDKTTTEEASSESETVAAESGSTEESVAEEASTEKSEENTSSDDGEITLTENVILKVSYVDEENTAIADEREISLSESLDFTSEAPKQEGYEFKKASIDDKVITKIVAKKDANEFKYYDITAEDGTVSSLKENKTVVLTYAKEVLVESNIKLTAKYVDKNGEEIKESSELKLNAETELKQDEISSIDGYFFLGASYKDQKISKITPVFEENKEAESNTEVAENTQPLAVKEYKASNDDSEALTINENSEIVFTYAKATTEKNFSYSDDKVVVNAELAAEKIFPEGIEFKVTEITSETENYNYEAYMNALNENADAIAKDAGQENSCKYTENNTLMYDIAFMYEGKEIQPKEGSVNVGIEFKNKQLSDELSAQAQEDISVVHLPIKEEVKEANEIESTEAATEITAEDIEVKTLTEATAEVGGEEKVEFSEDSFSIFAVISYQEHATGTDDFESVLGDAINFGIVAGKVTVKESQTNIATKELNGQNQFGNDLTNNAEQTFIASKINGEFQVKGFNSYFITDPQYVSHIKIKETGADKVKIETAYSSAQLDKIVEDMLQYTRNASADLYSDSKKAISIKKPLKTDTKDSDKYVIDIRGEGAGAVYITLDKEDMNKLNAPEKLRIYKNSDQTIVFNVTAENTVNLYKFGVSNDGGDLIYTDSNFNNTGDKIARSIIWNFINATEVNAEGSVAGVFISGRTDATWNHKATSSGWLVFPNVNVLSGEWHNTYDKIKKISGTAQFQAYKNIDGKEAKVSGFKFTLYKKDTTAEGGWREIETVTNDNDAPHNVIFSSITYGDNKTVTSANYQYTDNDATYVYKIVETQGYTDENHKSYSADKTVYYAKVDVKKQTLNQYTNNTYFTVSAPKYFKDENCQNAIDGELPVFNNKTGGSTGFVLHKYLNDQDPGNKKFTFTVRVVKPYADGHKSSNGGELITLTESLENIGPDITYNWEYTNDYLFENSIFFIVTENNVTDNNINKDNDLIVIRVQNPGTDKAEATYYKFDYENEQDKALIDGLWTAEAKMVASYVWSTMTKATCHNHVMKDADKRAFYNEGKTMLRIHKMVVNEFGSKLVRDGTDEEEQFNNSILSNVVFRITNQDTGDYVVFQGFTSSNAAAARYKKDWATGYKADKTKYTTYDVTYNQKAQWTITGLPKGKYTVEEVADGYTLGYDEKTNSSYILETQELSRVTKYDVTEDQERPDSDDYGDGGRNYRVVFSADLSNHEDDPPKNVTVGGPIQTVQVCNYYSKPLAPVKVTKDFMGSAWTSDMAFEFKLTPISYKAWDTAHKEITYKNGQPMPHESTVNKDGVKESVINVDGMGATINQDGSYSKVAEFGQIPYRFEGEYKYKITENKTNVPGVTFDEKAIYIKVDVVKKETRMHKRYNSVTNPRDYTQDGAERDDENFFYLAADVSYYSDESFSEDALIVKYTQRLGNDPSTGNIIKNEYLQEVSYINEKKFAESHFVNKRYGKLTVVKEWLDNPDGTKGPELNELWVYAYRKSDKEGSEWELYRNILLKKSDGWTYTMEDLPLTYIDTTDGKVYTYSYCVLEPITDQYIVKYFHKAADSKKANEVNQETNTENQTELETSEDAKCTWFGSYVITPNVSKNNNDLGTVTIQNTYVFGNTLPNTGAEGTLPYTVTGMAMAVIAVIAAGLYYRRNKEEE